ncbi:MAG: alpha/beta hydrolase [Vicinamibacterales bacterium]
MYGILLGEDPTPVIVPNGTYFAADLRAAAPHGAMLAYDLRNRGRSDAETDPVTRARGIAQDIDDLEAVRRQRGLARMTLVAHSYVGEVVLHYAMRFPDHVARVVAIAPSGYAVGYPDPPPPDPVAAEAFARLTAFLRTPAGDDPVARCRSAWEILAPLYVGDPALASRIQPWGRCEDANERAWLATWTRDVEPSLRLSVPAAADLARVTCPVLLMHGTRDRSAPYAASEAWAARLPDARLLTIEDAAHAPWIEAPAVVGPALRAFLGGAWPADAVRV